MTLANTGLASTRVKGGLGIAAQLTQAISWSAEGYAGNGSATGAKSGLTIRF